MNYQAMKRQGDPKSILVRETNQSEKKYFLSERNLSMCCMIPTIWYSEKSKTMKTIKDRCLTGVKMERDE